MNWFITAITSSVGKKLIMALAGLFLIIFLVVHLGLNLLLLRESSDWFNIAAHFMGTNVIVKIFEIVLFLGFFIHIIYGIVLQIQNWLARPKRYKIENLTSQTSFFSKWMIHTAVIILTFLVIHMLDFYIRAKFFGDIQSVEINGKEMHDMAALVFAKFHILTYLIIYLVAFVILAFHLNHAFQSAFQTLGVSNSKYSSIIKATGTLYSIIIPVGYAFIAIYLYMV